MSQEGRWSRGFGSRQRGVRRAGATQQRSQAAMQTNGSKRSRVATSNVATQQHRTAAMQMRSNSDTEPRANSRTATCNTVMEQRSHAATQMERFKCSQGKVQVLAGSGTRRSRGGGGGWGGTYLSSACSVRPAAARAARYCCSTLPTLFTKPLETGNSGKPMSGNPLPSGRKLR